MTIKELAEQLGVTKTTVRKYLTADIRAAYTVTGKNGVIEISATGANLIAEAFANRDCGNCGEVCAKPQTDCELSANQAEAIAETSANSVETKPQTANYAKDCEFAVENSEFAVKDSGFAETVCSEVSLNIPKTVSSDGGKIAASETITMPLSVWETLQQQLEQQQQQLNDYNARLQDITKALLNSQETAARAQALHAAMVQEQLTPGEPSKQGLFSRLFGKNKH